MLFIYVFTANVTTGTTSRQHVMNSYLSYEGRVFCITSPSVLHQQDTSYLQQLNLKAMVFRKLQNLASRQANAAVSKETANTQTSSDGEQTETILVCSPCPLSTAAEIPDIFVTNKGR